MTEPVRHLILDGWLCREVDGCTCGAGGPPGHEPYCGIEPEVRLDVLPGWPVATVKIDPPPRLTPEAIAAAAHDDLATQYRRYGYGKRPVPWRCRLGLHAWPSFVDAHTQAPARVRCHRCGRAR